MEKKPLTGLFRDQPGKSEGKYLVKRRDGSIVEWPHFVLGGRDPVAEVALRAYADEGERRGWDPNFVKRLRDWADTFKRYREEHGPGDPDMGAHREDDGPTVGMMRFGYSA